MDSTPDTEVILNLLEALCDYIVQYPPPGLTFEKIILRATGHFEILAMGWSNSHRIHAPLVHVDFTDGLVRIHHDGTDLDIAQWLMERGVKPEIIVPAHLPPEELKRIAPLSEGSA